MVLYFLIILGIAISRLYEVRLSKQHLKTAQKNEEVYPVQERIYVWMVGFHTCWLFSCVVEVYWLNREFQPFLSPLMILIWLMTLSARIWMLRTMKDRWNVRVIHHPNQTIVTTGPYQYLRHPNYLIVIIEIFCIPMIYSAYLTAVIGSCLNAILIWFRLKTEEPYLASLPGYNEKMGHLPRLIPQPILNFITPLKNRLPF